MKRVMLGLLLGLLSVPVFAQEEETPSVREDAFLAQKEIAVWRTDKAVPGLPFDYDICQAVRIHPQWLLTAAHCVYEACKGRSGLLPCTVEVTLAEAELRQRARVSNSTAAQNVFIYGGFAPGQNRISSLDVALVRLEPQNTTYLYDKWNEKEKNWEEISKKQFDAQLFHSPETKAQLSAFSPRLVSAANLTTSHLLPQIVVPRITDGVVSYLVSPSQDVFFVQELQHFLSPGFGVRQGNSGGGVFTAQGDLVGIVSSLIYSRNGNAVFQNDEGKTVLTLQNARDYFLFTGFNAATMNFIHNLVPNLQIVLAENGFVEPTDKPFADIVKFINRISPPM